MKDYAIGLKISKNDVSNCETCQLNKSEKIPRFWYSSEGLLEKVHTDLLGPKNPEAVDGHQDAIGSVESLIGYKKDYLPTTGIK